MEIFCVPLTFSTAQGDDSFAITASTKDGTPPSLGMRFQHQEKKTNHQKRRTQRAQANCKAAKGGAYHN